jgi:carboxylesterase type B
MGQSAGAVDICLLMASPLAAGSFEHAIMESANAKAHSTKTSARRYRTTQFPAPVKKPDNDLPRTWELQMVRTHCKSYAGFRPTKF